MTHQRGHRPRGSWGVEVLGVPRLDAWCKPPCRPCLLPMQPLRYTSPTQPSVEPPPLLICRGVNCDFTGRGWVGNFRARQYGSSSCNRPKAGEDPSSSSFSKTSYCYPRVHILCIFEDREKRKPSNIDPQNHRAELPPKIGDTASPRK